MMKIYVKSFPNKSVTGRNVNKIMVENSTNVSTVRKK